MWILQSWNLTFLFINLPLQVTQRRGGRWQSLNQCLRTAVRLTASAALRVRRVQAAVTHRNFRAQLDQALWQLLFPLATICAFCICGRMCRLVEHQAISSILYIIHIWKLIEYMYSADILSRKHRLLNRFYLWPKNTKNEFFKCCCFLKPNKRVLFYLIWLRSVWK